METNIGTKEANEEKKIVLSEEDIALNKRLAEEKEVFDKGVQSAKELVNKDDKQTTVQLDIEKEKDETKDENVEIKVNTSGIGSLKKFIGSKTKEHELAEDKEETEERNEGEELIGKYISDDEFQLIANVLIIVIDTVIVNIFKFWSGDFKDSSYGLPKPKQNQLTGILAQILKKHNVKWSLELLFVFLIVLGYSQQGIKAYEKRQENQKSKKALNVVRDKKVKVEETEEPAEGGLSGNETQNDEEGKSVVRKHYTKGKRKVGRPSSDNDVKINPENVREAA